MARPLLFDKPPPTDSFFKKWQQIRLGLKKYKGFFLEQYRQNSQEVIRRRHDNFHFQKVLNARSTLYPLMEFDSFMRHRGAKPASVSLKPTKPTLSFYQQSFLETDGQAPPVPPDTAGAATSALLSPVSEHRRTLSSAPRTSFRPPSKLKTANPDKRSRLLSPPRLPAVPPLPVKDAAAELTGKSFITERKTPELTGDRRVSAADALSLERQTTITTSRVPAEIPSKHVVFVVPSSFNPTEPEATNFAKVNLAALVSSLFPPPPKSVLEKEPPESILSYGRQVMLHEPTKQLENQAFSYLIQSLAEAVRDGGNEKDDTVYKYLFSIDGEPMERFAELTHEAKVLIISPHSRFGFLHGIDGFLDRAAVLRDREVTVRALLQNRGDVWYEENQQKCRVELQNHRKPYHARASLPGPATSPRLVALERQKRLVDLASADLQNRIGQSPRRQAPVREEDAGAATEPEFSLEETLAGFLEKTHYERKLNKWEQTQQIPEEVPGAEEAPTAAQQPAAPPRTISPSSPRRGTLRSVSQPRKSGLTALRSPSPLQPVVAKISNNEYQHQQQQRVPTAATSRRVGFQVQKMKATTMHMSIDFKRGLKIQKEIDPIMPTPPSREAPLLQMNRPQTGWSCSLEKYKRIKMTKRDMKALEGLVEASRALPPDHRKALKIVKESRKRVVPAVSSPNHAAAEEQQSHHPGHQQPRGLKFKQIQEFRQQYSLSRKEIYAIKSRFMSLDRMAQAAQTVAHKLGSPVQGIASSPLSPRSQGITLREFLVTSPLVKDLAPHVARRVMQALGVDPGNHNQKLDWKQYVELFCILTQPDTDIRILTKFWIKYIDPQSLGTIEVGRLVELLEELLKGKSEGANAWIIHHFSGNFIKRLVIEGLIDPDKRKVDLFKLENKFLDPRSVATPKMLSKATGMQEFQDIFEELTLTHEQERLFNHLFEKAPSPPPAPPKKAAPTTPSPPAAAPSEHSTPAPEKSYAEDGLESEESVAAE